MSTDGRMDKHNVYTYGTERSLALKWKEILTRYSMDESWGHYAK